MKQIKNKNIFFTGPIQIGKSTVINKILERYSRLKISGFRTQPIFENSVRKGFVLQSFDGCEKIFAHTDMESPNVFDVYKFDSSVFETFGVDILKRSLKYSELIVMDEVGQMEKHAKAFGKMIAACLDSPINVLGAIQIRASWFSQIISQRFDTNLIVINKKNRGEIHEYVSFE